MPYVGTEGPTLCQFLRLGKVATLSHGRDAGGGAEGEGFDGHGGLGADGGYEASMRGLALDFIGEGARVI